MTRSVATLISIKTLRYLYARPFESTVTAEASHFLNDTRMNKHLPDHALLQAAAGTPDTVFVAPSVAMYEAAKVSGVFLQDGRDA